MRPASCTKVPTKAVNPAIKAVPLPAVAAALFAFTMLPLTRLAAQEAPTPSGPPPASSAAPEQEPTDVGDLTTLKVQANLVNVYFSARDKGGFITNLKKTDCNIAENKVDQPIKNFTQEKNLPLTIGILLDTSGSQTNVLPLEQESGARFLKEVLTPKDEAFLISFDINTTLLADYTNSAREIKRAMDKATINTGTGSGSVTGNGAARGTLLYDAVYLAAHDKLRQEAGRKILVMLTDGGDQGSQYKIKDAIEAAQKANAIVYVILIADGGMFGTFGSYGAAEMRRLASETGGRVIDVGNSGRKLEDAFDQIQDELRTQYLLSYTPLNPKTDGTYRKLDLTCGKGYSIQARKGYYALGDSVNND